MNLRSVCKSVFVSTSLRYVYWYYSILESLDVQNIKHEPGGHLIGHNCLYTFFYSVAHIHHKCTNTWVFVLFISCANVNHKFWWMKFSGTQNILYVMHQRTFLCEGVNSLDIYIYLSYKFGNTSFILVVFKVKKCAVMYIFVVWRHHTCDTFLNSYFMFKYDITLSFTTLTHTGLTACVIWFPYFSTRTAFEGKSNNEVGLTSMNEERK